MSNPEHILKSLKNASIALAIADKESFQISFENALFFKWFPSKGDENETLLDRIPCFDKDKAQARIAKGRPYKLEYDIKDGARTIYLNIILKPNEDDDNILICECQNISKQKEAEFMLDSYSKMSEKKARELNREKERVEKLLLNIMPRTVYEELKDFGTTTPQRYDGASVLILDFVNFTEMTISQDPGAIIPELNDIFSAFDRIVELFDCERIKTIGDAYICVSGIPESNPEHAINIAKVALRMKRYLERRNSSHPNEWLFRAGIGTGSLIGSMVGIQKYVYDIFGPAVNLAARMESQCEPMTITLSESTYQEIEDHFSLTDKGMVKVKGFDEMNIYTLDYEKGRAT